MALPMQLQQNEEVIAIYRRHIVFLLQQIVGRILIIIIPLVALALLSPTLDNMAQIALSVVTIGIALIAFINTYFVWYRYQNDQWVVTNQRIVDSVRRNWFNHELSSTDLINVEDMSISRSGVFQTMFNYGDVRCQTAGQNDNFVLVGIPDPKKVLDVIDELRDAARRDLYGERPDMQQAPYQQQPRNRRA